VQPYGGRARTAVVEEGDRPRRGDPPFLKYATYDIIAPGSFFMSSIMIVPATAVYSRRLPRSVNEPRLSCRCSAYSAAQFSGAEDFDSVEDAALLLGASAA